MATGKINKNGIIKIFEGNVTFTNGYGKILASELLYSNCIPLFATSTLNSTLTFIFGGDSIGGHINIGMPFAEEYSGTFELTLYGFVYK